MDGTESKVILDLAEVHLWNPLSIGDQSDIDSAADGEQRSTIDMNLVTLYERLSTALWLYTTSAEGNRFWIISPTQNMWLQHNIARHNMRLSSWQVQHTKGLLLKILVCGTNIVDLTGRHIGVLFAHLQPL